MKLISTNSTEFVYHMITDVHLHSIHSRQMTIISHNFLSIVCDSLDSLLDLIKHKHPQSLVST